MLSQLVSAFLVRAPQWASLKDGLVAIRFHIEYVLPDEVISLSQIGGTSSGKTGAMVMFMQGERALSSSRCVGQNLMGLRSITYLN